MDGKNIRRRRESQHPSKNNKPLKVVLLVFLLVVLAILAYGLKMFSDIRGTSQTIYEDVAADETRLSRVDLAKGEEPFSVLLLGTDEGYIYDRDGGRSDTMIVVTVNPKTERVTMTSIPRDAYVWIPSHGKDKINHAYMEGGVELAINTVQIYLDIPIDFYVKINMEAVIDLVDSLGGIWITPSMTFSESGHDFYEGRRMKLDGEEALAYARMRKQDPNGDYGRQARQHELIKATVKELLSFSTFWEYTDILKSVEQNVQTNFTLDDLLDVFNNYRQAANTIDSYQLKGYTEIIDGIYYEIIPDDQLADLQRRLKYELELEDSTRNTPRPEDLNSLRDSSNPSQEEGWEDSTWEDNSDYGGYDSSTYYGSDSSSQLWQDPGNYEDSSQNEGEEWSEDSGQVYTEPYEENPENTWDESSQ